MKMQFKWIICCASLCFVTGTSVAQYGYGAPYPSSTDTNQVSKTEDTKEFFHAKDLVGLTAKDSRGEKLGKIHDIVVNPKNGESFAAIGIGDGRYTLVPSQALSVKTGTGILGRDEVTINTLKQTLQSGPSVRESDWKNLDNPSFTESVYSHYNLQAPSSAMGGIGTNSMGGSSKGSESSTNRMPLIPRVPKGPL
jgi:sporulation protein YlmC with PRC-barrel domain